MSRVNFRIAREPRGTQLRALLEVGIDHCDGFLIALTGMRRTERAEALLSSLSPFLTAQQETNEYPAASLPWGTVTVNFYRLDRTSLQLLQAAADRLFDWLEPDLPNDLCLMHGDEAWLITMASDGVAILALEESERVDLIQRVPSLRLISLTE